MPSPQKAIKVMFKENSNGIDDIENIEVGTEVIREIKSELTGTKFAMIERQGMGDWNIGYLPRK